MLRLSDLKPVSKLSEYAKNLPRRYPDVFQRYLDKIKVIGFQDPYTIKFRTSKLPTTVRTGSVIDYLINFRSPYTGEYMKNSRSLEGFKKFEGGFIHSVCGLVVGNFHVVVGKVMIVKAVSLQTIITFNFSGIPFNATQRCYVKSLGHRGQRR